MGRQVCLTMPIIYTRPLRSEYDKTKKYNKKFYYSWTNTCTRWAALFAKPA